MPRAPSEDGGYFTHEGSAHEIERARHISRVGELGRMPQST